eukprot:s1178_g7.t1
MILLWRPNPLKEDLFDMWSLPDAQVMALWRLRDQGATANAAAPGAEFGLAHPDDEDDVDEQDEAAAMDTLSELGPAALQDECASTVTPQTARDKKILRLSLQSSKMSQHVSSSGSSQSSKTSTAKTEKELDALAEEMKKAMQLQTPEKIEKPDKPGKMKILKLGMDKTKPDKPSLVLPVHVLQLMKESMSKPAPAPFAQSAQYKKNLTTDPDEDEDEMDGPAQAQAKPKRQTKKKKKPKKKGPAQVSHVKTAEQLPIPEPAAAEEYSPHRYAVLRKDFIDKLRNDGVAYKAAVDDWNNSKLKRQLLCNVPLQDLKRRRFVPKECQQNPWADA